MLNRMLYALLPGWRADTAAYVERRRIELARQLDRELAATVRYGPFRGLRLGPDTAWSVADRAPMLLGLYEQEVLESLARAGARRAFVNLGAGDGYYGVGALVAGLCQRSYCYEMGEKGRRIIGDTARLNGVRDRVEIRAKAEPGFYLELPAEVVDDCVLFVDIEGAEFELLDQAAFQAFAKAVIFVELHDWFFQDGAQRMQTLRRNAAATHAVSEMTTAARDLSRLVELREFSDSDRWLLCSEGRGRQMDWIRFDPKPAAAAAER
ncbi:hypothetical protein K4L06_00065 [Lysobacter sp. BMK333-48F3]|uniref:hypothetical protein n=1 Tax=Lysobacter sp. BMK333-48F3 TaxID=2867962 RepID=UPI001C8BBCD1|nr:hypothetical protein [Lysobacter sp. BMK333-48F3]MBX9399684.1 hypothetical protein [Lysobacter sp. BMK333-48F3]